MALNKSRINFINKYAGDIIESTRGTTLFPSLMMAQAILESTGKVKEEWIAGASKLTRECNNFFGIKDQPNDEWHGLSKKYITREVLKGKEVFIADYFRAYATPLDCFKDRNNFLAKNPRYAKAGVFSAKTPEAQAQALQKAGYATDPNYATSLIDLIKNYGLKKLDTLK
jgi:mannosyl-glycoprotein endo-beta-N-acetylglucosaminidase/stage II sporulation protein P